MTIAPHSFLSLAALSNVYFLTIPLCSCSTIHFHNLVRMTFIFVFPSLYLMCVWFFKAHFFITCPTNFKWFSLILSTFYVDFSLHLLFDLMLRPLYSQILLYNLISFASHLWRNCSTFSVIWKDWYYIVQLILILKNFTFSFLNTLLAFWKTIFAIPMRVRTFS